MLGEINNSTVSQRTNARKTSAHRFVLRRWRAADRGFTLLELMIVIVMIMILASVAIPAYQRSVQQSREATLRHNLKTLNILIQQYTLDKHQAPQTLDDLKTANYLHEIPVDPITRQADWETEPEDPTTAADPQQPGILRVHSAAPGTASTGEAYSAW